MNTHYRYLSVLLAVALFVGCAGSVPEPPTFDQQNAMDYLLKQCAFGPRVPGSAAHDSCRMYFVELLEQWADTVIQQPFTHYDSLRSKELPMTNVIARFEGKGKRRILCAHWDTRPIAEHDPDSSRQDEPILGANDGASGVAVCLEMARLFGQVKPHRAVDIVLFDGEDYGPPGRIDLYMLGSKHFARLADPQEYEWAILLDMVGDADLRLGPEEYSRRYAPELIDYVWSHAEELGIPEWDRQARYSIFDDHIPLLQKGIPAVDVIDFDYPYWHTHEDTPDKCSAESLGKVGVVMRAIFYDL